MGWPGRARSQVEAWLEKQPRMRLLIGGACTDPRIRLLNAVGVCATPLASPGRLPIRRCCCKRLRHGGGTYTAPSKRDAAAVWPFLPVLSQWTLLIHLPAALSAIAPSINKNCCKGASAPAEAKQQRAAPGHTDASLAGPAPLS